MFKYIFKYKFFWAVFFVLSGVIITIIYQVLKPKEVLPVYQPAQVTRELVDSTVQHIKKYHTIADFALINQNGDTITQEDYKDKIYIADFFFTTCQTICPKMTGNMVKIQETIKENPDVMLISHSVTPDIDSVAQLKKYALEKGVIDAKWNLVTGDKKQIYDLARKSYLVAKDVEYHPYDLVHTENFVLIDKKRRIRGFYDGTSEEEVQKLLDDLKILLKEE